MKRAKNEFESAKRAKKVEDRAYYFKFYLPLCPYLKIPTEFPF